MLRICEDLGSKERNNVVRDDFARFALKVGVVDAEAGVKPFDFVRNELTRNKTLVRKILRSPV